MLPRITMIKNFIFIFCLIIFGSSLKASESKKTKSIVKPLLLASSEYCKNANDYEKLQLSKKILKRLLNKIPNIPVVILANKCDISTSLNAKFLEGIFRSQRKLEVFDTSTKTGEGITDVKNWICSTLECS